MNYLVITGPSGAGKSTIIKRILKNNRFILNVSYTTRSPRPSEIDNVHYRFITKEIFENKIKNGELLEYTVFNGNFYGTPSYSEITDKIIIFDVDFEGALFFKEKLKQSINCLIITSEDKIKDRLSKRMILDFGKVDKNELNRRMENFYKYEKMMKDGFFNNIIFNNDLQQSFSDADDLANSVLKYNKMRL